MLPGNFGGSYKNQTSSGTACPVPGTLLGFYVNSTSAGTIALLDNGTAISGTITPAIGWHWFPVTFSQSLKTTIGGTLNVTLVFAAG